jgi:hypothetical protein
VTSTPARRIRIDLDIAPDAEPIGGQVRSGDGAAHTFSGWLELIELLERARRSPAQEGET